MTAEGLARRADPLRNAGPEEGGRFETGQELAKVAGDELRLALVADQLRAVRLEIGDADPVDRGVPRRDLATEEANAPGADDGEADALG